MKDETESRRLDHHHRHRHHRHRDRDHHRDRQEFKDEENNSEVVIGCLMTILLAILFCTFVYLCLQFSSFRNESTLYDFFSNHKGMMFVSL